MEKGIPKRENSNSKEKEIRDDLSTSQQTGGPMDEKDSVDRIRDILFGAQVRQYEQKFSLMEETIKSEIANIQDATRKAIETLENYTKKQIESLSAQIKKEQAERTDSFSDLSKNLDNANRNLDKKITNLDEKTNADNHDLHEQILQQSKTILKDIQQKHDEINAALKKAVEELRKDKTDRIALGNLLNEMGLRLKDEFKIPNVTS
jgi:hypothetical protein